MRCISHVPHVMVQTHRPRRAVSRATLVLLRLLFRYCEFRGAYVLRAVGDRWGPVLVPVRDRGSRPSIERRRSLPTAATVGLVIVAGLAGMLAALMNFEPSAGAPAAKASGDRVSAGFATPKEELDVRDLTAVMHPAATASGQQRQRARVIVYVRVQNRGVLPVTPAPSELRVGPARVQPDQRAPREFGLGRIAPGTLADARLRFEVEGAITRRLRTERRARMVIGGRTHPMRLKVGSPVSRDRL